MSHPGTLGVSYPPVHTVAESESGKVAGVSKPHNMALFADTTAADLKKGNNAMFTMVSRGQQELGTEGLLEEDGYLAECNLGDLEETSGMKETHWLLAIKAAREANRLEGIRVSTEEQHETTP
jgi:hypothetical protein